MFSVVCFSNTQVIIQRIKKNSKNSKEKFLMKSVQLTHNSVTVGRIHNKKKIGIFWTVKWRSIAGKVLDIFEKIKCFPVPFLLCLTSKHKNAGSHTAWDIDFRNIITFKVKCYKSFEHFGGLTKNREQHLNQKNVRSYCIAYYTDTDIIANSVNVI